MGPGELQCYKPSFQTCAEELFPGCPGNRGGKWRGHHAAVDIISSKYTPLAGTWLKRSLTMVYPLEQVEGQGQGLVDKLGHTSVIK